MAITANAAYLNASHMARAGLRSIERIALKQAPPVRLHRCPHSRFSDGGPPEVIVKNERPENEEIDEGRAEEHLLESSERAEPKEVAHAARQVVSHPKTEV